MKTRLVPEVCGCIHVCDGSPQGAQARVILWAPCRDGGGFGRLRVLMGSWNVSPAKAAVVVVVVLNWRAGMGGSCPGAMGRGGEEQRQGGGEGGCHCFFVTSRD